MPGLAYNEEDLAAGWRENWSDVGHLPASNMPIIDPQSGSNMPATEQMPAFAPAQASRASFRQSAARTPVDVLRDPEFALLPPERQSALKQEVLGHVIIDPEFKTLQDQDPGKAMNFLIQVNGANRQVLPTAEQTTLESPGEFGKPQEGDEHPILGAIASVITEPTELIGGIATGRFLGAARKGMAAVTGKTAAKVAEPLPKPTETPGLIPETPTPKPEVVPTAPVEKAATPAAIFEPQVKMERAAEVKDAVIQNVQALSQTDAKLRVGQRVVQGLNEGLIDVDGLPDLLNRTGLTMGQFTDELMTAYSTAGKQLNALSQIRKKMTALAETNPEAAAALERLNKEAPQTPWQKVKDAYRTVDNFSRGLIVSQIATSMRNISSQTARFGVEVFDQALEGIYKGAGPDEGLELATRFFANLKPGAAKEVMKILDHFPVDAAQLTGTHVGELTLGSKVTKLLNTLNTAQEQFYRRAMFDGTLRNGLKAKGLDVEAALANPASIPDDLIESSVRKSLEATFAAAPKPGTLGADILGVYQKIPFATTINPFPRFLMNSFEFLMEHNPLGAVRLMGKDAEGQFLAGNPAKRAEILSKATTGTVMLGAALALRESTTRGAKWYEINTGTDEDGKERVVDMRAYAPFSTFLFMADVMDLMATVGADTIKDGKGLRAALEKNDRYTTADVYQGVLSLNKVAGTGLVFVDLLKEGSMDRKMDILRDVTAQYLGRFTVPFRTVKDVVSAVDPEEAKLRDTRGTLLGPATANIPFASQTLPESASPTQAGPPKAEHPLLRQMTGVSVRHQNPVQMELSRLGIEFSKVAAKTGDPESDREVHARMGPKIEAELAPIVAGPLWKQLAPEIQRMVLTAAIMQTRSEATEQMKGERPDIEERMKTKSRIPANVKDLLVSLGMKLPQ